MEIVEHEVARLKEMQLRRDLRAKGIFRKPGNSRSRKGKSRLQTAHSMAALARAFYVRGRPDLAKEAIRQAVLIKNLPLAQLSPKES